MGGDVRPPRWADALLRTCLNDQDAETTSGDLLEAYRDSICPARGRWRADFWYLQQVFGCVVRARDMKLRNWLLAGLALCMLTIAFSLFMYPGVLSGWEPTVAVCFLFCGYVAAFHTRPVTPEDAVVLRLATRYGLAGGVPLIFGTIDAIFGTEMGGVLAMVAYLHVLQFVAGAHGGIKLWRVRAGMLVGFWSALISGLILFLGIMAMGYLHAFVPGLPGAEIPKNHPYTVVEYQQRNVGDNLGGGLVQLFYIGAFSVIGATLSGLTGMLLVRTGRTPEEPHRIRW